MLENSAEVRETYHRSGRVNWLIFLPGLAFCTFVSLVLAVCLYLCFELGWYIMIVVPALAALIAGGCWRLVVHLSHCRNSLLAGAGAVWLGILLYLGYYQVGLAVMVGPQALHRVDLLHHYIVFRMQTDIVRDVKDKRPPPGQGPAQAPNTFQQVGNWAFFGGELLTVICVMVGLGATKAAAAYCESCRKWMKSETVNLTVSSGSSMWDAVQRGDVAEARRYLANTAPANPQGCSVLLEYCPVCQGQAEDSRIYLTIKDVAIPNPEEGTAQKKMSSSVQQIVSQGALQPKELLAISPAFQALKGIIEATPVLQAEVKQQAAEQAVVAATETKSWKGQYAHVEQLEGLTSRVILTQKQAVIQTVIALVGIFGGLIGSAIPAIVVFGVMPKAAGWLQAAAVVWLFGGLALSLFWINCYPTYLSTLYMRIRSRKAFAARADSAVDWQDPTLVFVDIVPRANWGKMMMENASDIGFVELNKERGELVFEGDRERYWIPVDSILDVKHECFAEGTDHQGTTSLSHLIVVRAMTEKGPWETWLYRRHTTGRPRTAARKLADSLELENRIRELMRDAKRA